MCADEDPIAFTTDWKSDPLFSCCCNLFIKDILDLEVHLNGSQEGIFAYKNHPVRWVSIQGIVVKAEEKDKFHIYAVDDGTGVISCVCWKPTEDFNLRSIREDGTQSLIERMESWHLEQLTCLEVGDLVNIRGKLKMYRNAKQISAFSYGKVRDPCHTLEVRSLQEQVLKYKSVYDIPSNRSTVHTERKKNGEDLSDKSLGDISQEVAQTILLVSAREKYQNFYLHELETVPDINKVCCQPSGECTPQKTAGSKQVAMMLKNAVKHLLEKGYIFRSKRESGLLHLTNASKHLTELTCRTLWRECQKQEFVDGCDFLHLYNLVKTRNDFQYLTHAAMRRLLNSLEEQGMLVSCNSYQFLPVK